MHTRPAQKPEPSREAAPGGTPDQGADRGRPTAPFATIPRTDILRDVVALVCSALTFVLPWDFTHRGSQRIEVVLAVGLVVLACGLPYIARAGVLPANWTVHSTRRARLIATAPFFVVALVALGLDAATGGTAPNGGLGAGFAVGLAGALLVAAPRESELGPKDKDAAVSTWWSVALAGVAAVVGVILLLTVVFSVVATNATTEAVIRAFVHTAFVVTLAILCGPGIYARLESARLTLVGLGLATGVALVVTGTALGPVSSEGMHATRCGLVMIPALGAIAAGAPICRVMSTVPPADAWLAMARRSIDVLLAVTGYCAILGALMLTRHDGRVLAAGVATAAVLCLVIVAAVRRPMAKDPIAGRPLVLVAMAAVSAVGVAVLFIMGGAHRAIAPAYILLAVGVPAMVAWGLAGPSTVRARVLQERKAIGVPEKAYLWSPPEPKPVRSPKVQGTGGQTAAAAKKPGGGGAAAKSGSGGAPAASSGGKPAKPGVAARLGLGAKNEPAGEGDPVVVGSTTGDHSGTTVKTSATELRDVEAARSVTASRQATQTATAKLGREAGKATSAGTSPRNASARDAAGRGAVGQDTAAGLSTRDRMRDTDRLTSPVRIAKRGGAFDGTTGKGPGTGAIPAAAQGTGTDRTDDPGIDRDTVPNQGPRLPGLGATPGRATDAAAPDPSDDQEVSTHAIPVARGRTGSSGRIPGGGQQASTAGQADASIAPDLSGDTRPSSLQARFEPPAEQARPAVEVDDDTTGPRVLPASRPPKYTVTQALDPDTPLEVLALIAQDAPHLRPEIAANPSTYPALLEWLGNLGDPAVDAALRSRS